MTGEEEAATEGMEFISDQQCSAGIPGEPFKKVLAFFLLKKPFFSFLQEKPFFKLKNCVKTFFNLFFQTKTFFFCPSKYVDKNLTLFRIHLMCI